ncbi:hypothetical protein BDZ97DRAFT_1835473 [Flammula alnicola]|nr:hypothetical protein BDZ97DRAFT_1835473 [Flammula alnicola]
MLRSSATPSSISLLFILLSRISHNVGNRTFYFQVPAAPVLSYVSSTSILARSFSPAIYMTRRTWVASAKSLSPAMLSWNLVPSTSLSPSVT